MGVLPSRESPSQGSTRADAGIVISASHNPFEDNGIKIFGSEGFKLPDEKESAIEEAVLANHLPGLMPSPTELGKAYRMDDARGRYIVFLKHAFPKEHTLEGTRIVLDCSHGATYRVAPETFLELGAEVSTLFDERTAGTSTSTAARSTPKPSPRRSLRPGPMWDSPLTATGTG